MATILDYLKNVWLRKTHKFTASDLNLLLPAVVLATIPLEFKYNSIAIIIWALYSIFSFKIKNVSGNKYLLLPILLFIFMALSLLWTINFQITLKALGKEVVLLLVPILFYINKKFTRQEVTLILKYFSYAIICYGIFYLCRAIYSFSILKNADAFFYHELAGENAIYVSAVFSVALFYFIDLHKKKLAQYIALFFITTCIILFSSKTIILLDVVIITCYYTFSPALSTQKKIVFAVLFLAFIGTVGYKSKIRERLASEYNTNSTPTYTHVNSEGKAGIVHDISVKEAWTNKSFSASDRFSGTSFRIYQIRIFSEMLADDNIFLLGYGLNSSQKKIEEKGHEHGVFLGDSTNIGYQTMNFHNQYIQVFAELGLPGLLLLLALVFFNLKKAVNNKYFVHIAFAILMLTLFLTESFIWRQRGVVLFTVLYCMFNTIAPKEKEIQ